MLNPTGKEIPHQLTRSKRPETQMRGLFFLASETSILYKGQVMKQFYQPVTLLRT